MTKGATVVVIGAASRDLTDDDPRGWRLGGGASYSALALAKLGLHVRALLGADAEASRADELQLLIDAGVDLVVAPLERGPVFVNTETPGGRVQVSRGSSSPITTSSLPVAWSRPDGWLFAPVAAELPDRWAAVPGLGSAVGVGWQGLLRVLGDGGPVRRVAPGASPIVARADLVGVGRDDLDPATDLDTLATLLGRGATLLVTNGERGGMAIDIDPEGRAGHRRTWPAIPSPAPVDPTGAGDTFLATVFAARVEPRLIGGRRDGGWDLRLGAAAASLVCEAPGLLGVPDRQAIARRMRPAPAA
jgi:sugar/nucleoside kinase (ribokinase family)